MSSGGQFYVSPDRERWRQLLAMPLDQAAAIVLADTDEGAQLRHAHPFAAILTQADRQLLHSTAC